MAIEPAIRRGADTLANTTRGYRFFYCSVVPSVVLMSDLTAYDDPAAPSEMTADCLAAEAHLDIHSVARTIHVPAPSLHFDDLPEMTNPEIHPVAAAQRLAAALGLDLD